MTAQAWRHGGARVGDRTGLGLAAWGASVFLLLIFSQAWIFPLMGEKADPSASGLIRAIFIPAYLAGLFVLALAPAATMRGLARQPFLIALMAIVALSITWSVAPDQTARRIVALYLTTICGVVLAARWRWSELAEIVATTFAVLAVASLLAGLFLPNVGRMENLFPGSWRGLWPEKNSLGGNMALGFVLMTAAAALNPLRARLWWGFAVLCLLLVAASTSKTSLVALALGIGGLVLVGLMRRGPAARVATIWATLVGVAMIAGIALFAADQVFDLLGKDATLTGRTKIWSAALRQIEERPWTGFGYGAVWDETGAWGPLAWITKDAGFRAQHAHNSWLEQWLGLGLFGLATFVLFYLQTLALAVVAVFRSAGAWLAVPFLVVYTLMTLTESVSVTYNDLRWVLFVAFAVKLALPDSEPARSVARPPRRL